MAEISDETDEQRIYGRPFPDVAAGGQRLVSDGFGDDHRRRGTHTPRAHGPVAMIAEWLIVLIIALVVFGPLLLRARKKTDDG